MIEIICRDGIKFKVSDCNLVDFTEGINKANSIWLTFGPPENPLITIKAENVIAVRSVE